MLSTRSAHTLHALQELSGMERVAKTSLFGETEAGRKAPALWDVSQEPKAENPGLSQPRCCLCRGLGYPPLRVLSLRCGPNVCLGFFCRLCAHLRKCSCGGQLGEKRMKIKAGLMLAYHISGEKQGAPQAGAVHAARGGHRGGNSELCHQLEELPFTERLRAEKEMSKEALPLFLSFLPQNSLDLCHSPSCSQFTVSSSPAPTWTDQLPSSAEVQHTSPCKPLPNPEDCLISASLSGERQLGTSGKIVFHFLENLVLPP